LRGRKRLRIEVDEQQMSLFTAEGVRRLAADASPCPVMSTTLLRRLTAFFSRSFIRHSAKNPPSSSPAPIARRMHHLR
jgi:hypothetical protein